MKRFSLILILMSLFVSADAHAARKKASEDKDVYNIRKAFIDARIMEIVRKVQREESIKRAVLEKKKAEEEAGKNKKEKPGKYAYSSPEKEIDPELDAVQVAEPDTADLEIVFDKKRVNFERKLRQLITAAERGKAIAHYDVVSEVPIATAGGRRNEIQMGEYQQNINKVLSQMNKLGVQPTRIDVESTSNPEITSQVIKIYQN